jgi:hypothetical protein
VHRVEPRRAQIEAHFSCCAEVPMLEVLALGVAVAVAVAVDSSSVLTSGGLGTEVSMPVKRFL